MPSNDTNSVVPEKVIIAYRRAVSGDLVANAAYPIEITLTSLALAELSDVAGFSGSKTFHDDAIAFFASDGDLTPTNYTNLLNLSRQIAADYYRWQLGRSTARFEGVFPWVMEGHTDTIEFEYTLDRISTRTKRGPWKDDSESLCHWDGDPNVMVELLAQLTAKCYFDGSDTRDLSGCPTGDGLNCAPEPDCVRRNIAYSWRRVIDGVDPVALTYLDGVSSGSPQCWPAYHEQDVDLAVFPPASPILSYPRTLVSSSAAGDVAWTDPEKAARSNDSWASCALSAGQSTHYLKATAFCYGIGGNATVDTIGVTIEAHASADTVSDVEIKLVVGGVIVGTNRATGTVLTTTDSTITVSFSPGSWGVTLTSLDANAADFGVAIRYTNGASEARIVYVDAITLSLGFSPAGFLGAKWSIVRLRKGKGDWYLIDQTPHIDLFRRTDDSDAYGYIGYERYYDPNDGDWKDGAEVRIVLAE